MTDDLTELLVGLERSRCEATSTADLPALREIYTDDLTYTHSSGLTQNLGELLAGLVKFTPRVSRTDDLQVRFFGDVAVMTGTLRAELPGPPGPDGPRIIEPHALQVWVRQGERWKQAAYATSGETSVSARG